MKKFIFAPLIALAMLALMLSGGVGATAAAAACGTPAQEAVYETQHVLVTEAVPGTPAVPAVPAVVAVPSQWWNWSPNHTEGPQDYTPAFPSDSRGTWQGPHTNGGPNKGAVGTFNVSHGSKGNSSWFHRSAAVAGVPAVPAKDAVEGKPAVYKDVKVKVKDAVPAGPACPTPTPSVTPTPTETATPVVTPTPTVTPTKKVEIGTAVEAHRKVTTNAAHATQLPNTGSENYLWPLGGFALFLIAGGLVLVRKGLTFGSHQ